MSLDESNQKLLNDLKTRRRVVKSSLTRIKTFVVKFQTEDRAVSELKFRQEQLPQINKNYDDVQSQIELISQDYDKEEEDRENFESDYFAIRSQIQDTINSKKVPSSSSHELSFSSQSNKGHVNLAPVILPEFSGNIQEWEAFINIFNAMVHNDLNRSVAEKFFHLRSCLKEEALDLIKSVPITDINYAVVIERLKKRYDNRALTIQSHIRSILEAPKIQKPSAKDLQNLYSHVSTHLAALKALDQPIDQWDAWLVTIVISRLDTNTRHEWQLRQNTTELPTYRNLEEFLSSRCIAFETSEAWCSKPYENDSHHAYGTKRVTYETRGKKATVASGVAENYVCPCCKGAHKIFACEAFRNLTVSERVDKVRENHLCFNCLSSFHMAKVCNSINTCNRCSKKHNTLLHFETKGGNHDTANTNMDHQIASTSGNSSNVVATPVVFGTGNAFLATASVNVIDRKGVSRRCRAVLDSGSMVNFISKRLQNTLQLSGKKVLLPVTGIGKKKVQATSQVTVQVRSRLSQFKVDLACYILSSIISDLPSCATPTGGWKIAEDMIPLLADPLFDQAGPVDILIGGGVFFELLETGRIPLGIGNISLQESKLGWVVTGEMGVSCLMSLGEALEENWRIGQQNEEEDDYGKFSKANQKCLEEEQALKHFRDTARRDETGRFVLHLPFKPEVDQIGETLAMATSRFLSVERRLQRDEALKTSYINFMDEYLQMGHMEEVINHQASTQRQFYLPHHPVLKASSLTTKLRVVFDASAKSSSGLSLNDVLLCGPTVQEELFSILIRFRKHQFVLMADVEKMFRQVNIRKEDRDMQRIVWRSDPKKQLHTYRLSTVTYGTTSASFMTTNCLITLADESKNQYPLASEIVRRDFYMDDLMTGSNTIEECCQLRKQIHAILETAKFPLRKWCSNSQTILENIGTVHNDPLFTLTIGVDDVIKSLGLSWKPAADSFTFHVEANLGRTKVTKRILLSDLNRVFDPMGFLVPVLIRGKIFMQQIWQLKLEWDKSLTDDLKRRWEDFHQQLRELSNLSIPRKVIPSISTSIEIHGFCDASLEAYGAAIYIRSKDTNGQWHSRLLCAKSRVAPLKALTIPRLELSGALTLAQLSIKVANAWELNVNDFYLWTDSLIVLGWLNSQSTRLKTFVANRVGQILSITKIKQWHHVKTNENPADVVSRGLTPQGLANSNIWWYGPPWLVQDTHTWKASETPLSKQELPEQRPLKLALTVTKFSTPWLLEQYSEWTILIRITAYVLRFVQNLKISKNDVLNRIKGPLTTEELLRSKYHWIRVAQSQTFANEINALKSNTTVHRSSCLKTLSPFLDEYGIVRVGGRLTYAPISNSKKHPIVLPARCKVTSLIFTYEHKRLLHIGPQGLLAHLQNTYWPIRGRIIARRVVNKCIICFRARPTMLEPFMAPLPRERVTKDRVFAKSGVDFCGPFMIRSGLRRVTPIKHYVALFVCLVTRAIHLELVRDLSSDAFLAAFFRFISRRGQCAKLFSDNGTNFVGANKILKSWLNTAQDDARIASKLSEMGIDWTFIPPASPHFGGLWESGVKSAKHHLTRVVKSALLNYEEMVTLLCRVEAVLNSRPITPLSSDPADYEALTPGHFLVGGPLTLPPEPDHSEVPLNRLRHFTLIQSRLQLFWQRWSSEYLPQMQRRGRWTSPSRTPIIGDLVILQDNLLPPIQWQLVRVTKLHPGADNVVRVVTVRNSSGQEFRRPVVKIALLPTEEDDDKDVVEI